MELSYYQLLLTDFLKDTFPEKLSDRAFIQSRAAEAAGKFSLLTGEGIHRDVASDEANAVLFEGLTGFSKYSYIRDVLREDFQKEVPDDAVDRLALSLLPGAEEVFQNYDDAGAEADAMGERKMYWELIGFIDTYIKAHGLQQEDAPQREH